MRKFAIGVIVLCLLWSPAYSQIRVKDRDRVVNIDPGFCAFCVLEMLGRHHKIEPLYNLVKKRQKESAHRAYDTERKIWRDYVWTKYPGGHYRLEANSGGGDQALRNKLDSLGVKYRIQNYGSTDKSLIKYAIKNKLGCMIVVKDWTDDDPVTQGSHAVLMTNYDDEHAYFIDPNDKDEYRVDWEWFDYYWMGYVLVVEKEEK